jgi:hypothetical protein
MDKFPSSFDNGEDEVGKVLKCSGSVIYITLDYTAPRHDQAARNRMHQSLPCSRLLDIRGVVQWLVGCIGGAPMFLKSELNTALAHA